MYVCMYVCRIMRASAMFCALKYWGMYRICVYVCRCTDILEVMCLSHVKSSEMSEISALKYSEPHSESVCVL